MIDGLNAQSSIMTQKSNMSKSFAGGINSSNLFQRPSSSDTSDNKGFKGINGIKGSKAINGLPPLKSKKDKSLAKILAAQKKKIRIARRGDVDQNGPNIGSQQLDGNNSILAGGDSVSSNATMNRERGSGAANGNGNGGGVSMRDMAMMREELNNAKAGLQHVRLFFYIHSLTYTYIHTYIHLFILTHALIRIN